MAPNAIHTKVSADLKSKVLAAIREMASVYPKAIFKLVDDGSILCTDIMLYRKRGHCDICGPTECNTDAMESARKETRRLLDICDEHLYAIHTKGPTTLRRGVLDEEPYYENECLKSLDLNEKQRLFDQLCKDFSRRKNLLDGQLPLLRISIAELQKTANEKECWKTYKAGVDQERQALKHGMKPL